VALAELRGMALVTPRPAVLCFTLRSRDAPRSANIRVAVESEQPLGPLRSIVEELLATSRDIDARVEIEVAGQPGLPLKVERFRWPEMKAHLGYVHAPKAPAHAQAVARMMDDPKREYALSPHPEPPAAGWILPGTLAGTCLVYLREGADVVSRPGLVSAIAPAPPCEPGSIRAAVRTGDQDERQAALAGALTRMASNSESASRDRAWLIGAILGLNGLPATTLDALKELARCPDALAHLLTFVDGEDERSAIHNLERQLPFLWLAQPVAAWRNALAHRHESVMAALVAALPGADHASLAMHDLRQRADAIMALEPGLETVLSKAGLPIRAPQELLPLDVLASAHIRASDDRDRYAAGDTERFGSRLSVSGLPIPDELRRFDLPSHGGLLAPCLLAASAASRLRLNPEDLLAVRRWLRDDPDYVSRAFGVILPRYLRQLP
jgi:hypothetical protein